MAKPMKSQWDFGELFPPEARAVERKVLSVTELTGQIRRLLEKQVGLVWVGGEITNLRAQGSGHIYFTLKDATAQLSCVLFRGERQVDRALLSDGQKISAQGEVTVYEPRGQYQLRVTAVELQGVGALQAAFEKLKARLNAEGLFAPERKRALPRYPQRIGLVTSPTGAAIRDVLHVVQRRNPALEIVLAPCRVQGEGAAAEIAEAIRLLNEFNRRSSRREEALTPDRDGLVPKDQSLLTPAATSSRLDLILITRGGGSLEDLWAFNEEVVARAIFESAVPVVSAVGHEIDFTISDFVADARAATPSAAAEVITEGVFSSCQFISAAAGRVGQLARQQLADKLYVLGQTSQRLTRLHPRRVLEDRVQWLDELQNRVLRCVKQSARRQRLAWQNLSDRLLRVRPAAVVKQRRDLLERAERRLREQMRHDLEMRSNRSKALGAHLRLLGPEQVLARGYSITSDVETGAVLREVVRLKAGQRLKTRLKGGEVISRVEA
jgi:exodeoxyribonuclease VII large subunit